MKGRTTAGTLEPPFNQNGGILFRAFSGCENVVWTPDTSDWMRKGMGN